MKQIKNSIYYLCRCIFIKIIYIYLNKQDSIQKINNNFLIYKYQLYNVYLKNIE